MYIIFLIVLPNIRLFICYLNISNANTGELFATTSGAFLMNSCLRNKDLTKAQ